MVRDKEKEEKEDTEEEIKRMREERLERRVCADCRISMAKQACRQ